MIKITDKNAKKLTIPATVKVKGVTYKVTAISDRAFKGVKKNVTITVKGTKKAKTALKKKLKKSSIGYVKTWKIK